MKCSSVLPLRETAAPPAAPATVETRTEERQFSGLLWIAFATVYCGVVA